MRDKYYTPELEEFHVGFEYERWMPKYGWAADDYSVGKFYPYTFRDGEAAEQYVDSDMARVKYLDREDIESFGVKFVGRDDFGSAVYKTTKPHAINHDMEYCITSYHKSTKVRIESMLQGGMEGWAVIFDGIIKNKSELGRILRQIGYEQEL